MKNGIKKAYSIRKLRRNILWMTNGDNYFNRAAGFPTDMFFHIFDKLTKNNNGFCFYVSYFNDEPAFYLAINKANKYIAFYVNRKYRRKEVLSDLFNFVHNKIGNDFFVGTVKRNDRFIDYAIRQGWTIEMENNNEIIFKGICR